ncbi:MAG TPA: hypothetical protein VJR94_09795 [Candidatus Nitrosocosmicus sp.]|nr:hypothetical protein [Candidatus Nitrosocosmicus sp.]
MTLQYLHWYENLKYLLKNNSGIEIEQVINDFVNMIIEFKVYDFDTLELIRDYMKMKSLKGELIEIQTEIDKKIPIRDSLLTEIQELNLKRMQVNQTLRVYRTLEAMSFGLKELKQLWYTVIEIAAANNIKVEEAVKKFLWDLQNDYDNKLGFEIAVSRLESKKMQLEEEFPLIKNQRPTQLTVSASLDYLKNKGVTDLDIIRMSDLVRIFIGNNLLSNYDDTKIIRDNPWYFFISDFTIVKDLKLEIKTLISIRDNIKREIDNTWLLKGPVKTGYLETMLNPYGLDGQANQNNLKSN